jgi:hypothetical protein
MLNDELIGAYLDGELAPEKRALVERQLAGNNGAAARLERMRSADALLRRALPGSARSEKDPLAALIMGGWQSASRSSAPHWGRRAAAIAAACLIGVLAGRLSAPDSIVVTGMSLSAEATRVLDRVGSGELAPVAGGQMQVALSFRTESGEVCRQFRTNASVQTDAVACRVGDGWNMIVQAAVRDTDGAGYRTASADDAISAAVNALGGVSALDDAEERALIDANWRAPD